MLHAREVMEDVSDYAQALRRVMAEYPAVASEVRGALAALRHLEPDLAVPVSKMIQKQLRHHLKSALPDVPYKRIKGWCYSTFQVVVKKAERGEPTHGIFTPEAQTELWVRLTDGGSMEGIVPTALVTNPRTRPAKPEQKKHRSR